jgi:hypothetical protein
MTQVAVATDTFTRLVTQCRSGPIVFDDMRPDLCLVLEQIIDHRAKTTRSTASLNVGGWKSGEDFFAWPDPAVQELRRLIVATVGSSKLVAWAMVNRAGSQHPRHQHRIAVLTGVYYVAVGSEDSITPTVFEYPGGELEIAPRPGRLALFRGEAWHRVPIYRGDLPRITVAFDVRR